MVLICLSVFQSFGSCLFFSSFYFAFVGISSPSGFIILHCKFSEHSVSFCRPRKTQRRQRKPRRRRPRRRPPAIKPPKTPPRTQPPGKLPHMRQTRVALRTHPRTPPRIHPKMLPRTLPNRLSGAVAEIARKTGWPKMQRSRMAPLPLTQTRLTRLLKHRLTRWLLLMHCSKIGFGEQGSVSILPSVPVHNVHSRIN